MKWNSSYFFPALSEKKGHLLFTCALPVLQYYLCVMAILLQTEFRGGLMPVGKSSFLQKAFPSTQFDLNILCLHSQMAF